MKLIDYINTGPSETTEPIFPEINHTIQTQLLHIQINLTTNIRVKYHEKWYKLQQGYPVKILIDDVIVFHEALLKGKVEFLKECYKTICSFDEDYFEVANSLGRIMLDDDQRNEKERLTK